MSWIEILLSVMAIMAAWIGKLKYSQSKREIEDALVESEVSHRAEKIKDFEAYNKEAYDELVKYIDSDDAINKF